VDVVSIYYVTALNMTANNLLFDPADSPREHHTQSPGKQQISLYVLCFKKILHVILLNGTAPGAKNFISERNLQHSSTLF
jgi:hypothetical protein